MKYSTNFKNPFEMLNKIFYELIYRNSNIFILNSSKLAAQNIKYSLVSALMTCDLVVKF